MSTATGRRLNQATILQPDRSGPDAKTRLLKDMQRQNMLDKMAETEDKATVKRAFREQAHLSREQQIQESLIRAETDKIMRTQVYEQEERLARELERIKLDQMRDEKMRQQLRENRYFWAIFLGNF